MALIAPIAKVELVMDQDKIQKELAAIEEVQKKVGAMVIQLGACTVRNKEDYDLALEMGTKTKAVIDDLLEKKDEINAPYKKITDSVSKKVKSVVDALNLPLTQLRARCQKWLTDEENKRRKEQEELSKKLKEEEEKAKAAATPEIKAVAEDKADRILVQQVKVAKTEPESKKKVRETTLVDASLVPREFCVPDMVAIRAKAGKVGDPITAIPGVKIEDVVKAVFG